MSLVWDIKLTDSQKIILLSLADNANDDGLCWPSIATIAKRCSKSERTVQGVIKQLVNEGHLTRHEVHGRGCKYYVHPRSHCTPEETAPRSHCTPPPQPLRPTPAAAAPKPSKNHQEPSTKRTTKVAQVEDSKNISLENITEAWNELAKSISRPQIKSLTPSRRQLLKARIAQYELSDFINVLAKIRGSPFLRGDNSWKGCTFDWVFKAGNFQKILEGNYDE